MELSSNTRLSGPALVAVAALFAIGCNSKDRPNDPCPELPARVDVGYRAEFLAHAPSDSVLLMIGGGVWAGYQFAVPKVSLNARVSLADSVIATLHVMGEVYEGWPTVEPGVVDFQWSGDTLKVWCDLDEPYTWEAGSAFDKCSPAPLYVYPDSVDLVLPAGTGFRYIKRIGREVGWWR